MDGVVTCLDETRLEIDLLLTELAGEVGRSPPSLHGHWLVDAVAGFIDEEEEDKGFLFRLQDELQDGRRTVSAYQSTRASIAETASSTSLGQERAAQIVEQLLKD